VEGVLDDETLEVEDGGFGRPEPLVEDEKLLEEVELVRLGGIIGVEAIDAGGERGVKEEKSVSCV